MSKNLPSYKIVEEGEHEGTTYFVLTKAEAHLIPEGLQASFLVDEEATHVNGKIKTIFLTPQKASSTNISSSVTVRISPKSGESHDYLGSVSDFLSSAYVFWRKSSPYHPPVISVVNTAPHLQTIIALSEARNQTRQWGNGRGDIEGTPQFFQKIADEFAKEHNLKITIISGDDLVKQRFNLLHAVGRASVNPPVFVNLAYNGNPDSNEWVSYVGKGVCFDTGGLNIKTATGMLGMFLDKLGAITVLSSFQTIVREKIPLNLTCSIGLVQNSVSQNSYRPSDIITSRKGLTVEIGNTDAEGRLVLADCMNWVQEHFNVKTLIELSTLTGAVITALGHEFTGLFTNDEGLTHDLRSVGQKVHERSWQLPCSDYHKDMISPKHCDLSNMPGSNAAGSSQAAAFLKSFVEKNTKWAHLDIAGTAMQDIGGWHATGWGSRLLVEYARFVSAKKTEQPQHHQHHGECENHKHN